MKVTSHLSHVHACQKCPFYHLDALLTLTPCFFSEYNGGDDECYNYDGGNDDDNYGYSDYDDDDDDDYDYENGMPKMKSNHREDDKEAG
jgi:hypothetical protein